MFQRYSITEGKIVLAKEGGETDIEIYTLPDDAERSHLINDYGIDEHTLISSIDPDEAPRLEFEDNHTALILKYPKNYSAEDNFLFKVKSMGIFLFPSSRIVIVLDDDNIQLFSGRCALPLREARDVMLRVMLQTIRHFETHLRVINMCSDEIEHEIIVSSENKNLLNMFTLEKGLVYYVNALSGNRRVIERIRANVGKIGFSEENIEFLEDLAIENRQFLDQAQMYSQVLSGMMDARASIINNNLNVMMKNLNAIVIAISIPTFITGVGGMSEFTSLLAGKRWILAYPLFITTMILLGIFIYHLITKKKN